MSTKGGLDVPKPRNSLIRSVGVLVGGSVIAHGITVLAVPVLSLLYSPADCNALAVFTNFLTTILVAACLRLAVAVTIPHRDTDAANLLALLLGCALVVALLVAAPVRLVPGQIAEWLNQAMLHSYLWPLSVGLLLAASYSTLQDRLVPKKSFGQIVGSREAQSAAAEGWVYGSAAGSSDECTCQCNLQSELSKLMKMHFHLPEISAASKKRMVAT